MGGTKTGSIRVQFAALWDIVCTLLYGFHEDDAPTNADRTSKRRRYMIQACETYLNELVGPGDLLDSGLRHEFATEAYAGFGSPINMRTVSVLDNDNSVSFAEYNRVEIQHNYVTTGPLRDVALAIVNFQAHLDEDFFDSVADRLKKIYPSHSLDDCRAMVTELGIIAAGCDGVRTFCAAAGISHPPLPEAPVPVQDAHFQEVEDYSLSPLKYNPKFGWGPFLATHQIRPSIFDKYQLDGLSWELTNRRVTPISTLSAAPTTCQASLEFNSEMYVPPSYFPLFLRVPGSDRHLARAQLEPAAAAYTAAKHCRF
jgi:hypothetical protein